MSEGPNSTSRREDHEVALRTYLRDHTAGAQHALALFQALGKVHAGTDLGDFADGQFHQVKADLKVFEQLARDAGADGYELMEAAGWLADKLSRLKLAPLDDPFHTFEAREFLSLGILGKRALWKALLSVATEHPVLAGIDFANLIERAEQQHAATEEKRLATAVQAFGEKN